MASRSFVRRRSRRAPTVLAAIALALAMPASSLGFHTIGRTDQPAYMTLTAGAGATAELIALVSSGEDPFGVNGVTFEGIPDGLGFKPIGAVVPGVSGTVDVYVTHEQSHVPFAGFADFVDSSVTRVTIDVATKTVISMQEALPPSAGFIRFCSAFMAGPEHGFADYTFLVNEESNDNLPVPAGATYSSDPSLAGLREAGYSVWLNTDTLDFAPITRMGRHNHENAVALPLSAGYKNLAVFSGDDTFSPPQTNGSQLYLFTANDAQALMNDKGQLWAFQVTADDGVPVDPYNPSNDANDYLDIAVDNDPVAPGNQSEVFSGRFIHVPTDIARGTTAAEPQQGLEDWSNANNVFQFIRVEDIAYDPVHPRTLYFADTGSSVIADVATGRMTGVNGTPQRGRIFKLELNTKDPRIVDSFSILADGSSPASLFNRPDNIAISAYSLMVQEDTTGGAKTWRMNLSTGVWTHVATVIDPPAPTGGWTPTAVQGESSGIVDASAWLGSGWWALDVQSHRNESVTDYDPALVWDGPPGPVVGHQYQLRREHGQLLLMYIPGS